MNRETIAKRRLIGIRMIQQMIPFFLMIQSWLLLWMFYDKTGDIVEAFKGMLLLTMAAAFISYSLIGSFENRELMHLPEFVRALRGEE